MRIALRAPMLRARELTPARLPSFPGPLSPLTKADLALYVLCNWLSSGILDGIPTTILEPYEGINKIVAAVAGHPKVAEFEKGVAERQAAAKAAKEA